MKKISVTFRKFLRAVYLTVGAGVVSLVFVACYGMPLDYHDYEDNPDHTTENSGGQEPSETEDGE